MESRIYCVLGLGLVELGHQRDAELVELWSFILLTLLPRLLTEFACFADLGNLDINSKGRKLVRTGTKRGIKLELNRLSNLLLYEVARFLST